MLESVARNRERLEKKLGRKLVLVKKYLGEDVWSCWNNFGNTSGIYWNILVYIMVPSFWIFFAIPLQCLFKARLLFPRQGKSVTGGKDLALSAAYTTRFCSALFSAWLRMYVLYRTPSWEAESLWETCCYRTLWQSDPMISRFVLLWFVPVAQNPLQRDHSRSLQYPFAFLGWFSPLILF